MILLTGFIQAYMLGWTMPSGLYGNAIMALVYLSNFEYWRPHVKSIWKNTWSLATEEQFYIIWSLLLPFLLLQTPERRRNFIVGLIFGSLLLSTMKAACIYSNPDWLFGDYSPLSNFWKMFVGSLLRLSISSSRNIKPYFCWTGLTVLCLSILATVPASPIDLRIVGADPRSLGYQVFMEPIAVICAILIILGSLNGNWLLETKAVRFVGSISYSLYLYQIPILEIRNWPRGMDAVGLSSLAFILAMISTLYIEEPLRAYYKKALHAAL
jgi:peptidoglycan/LPS O-acetylase OafA/YrhL